MGPLSLFNWNFVKEEMDIFFNRTRPYPGTSESVELEVWKFDGMLVNEKICIFSDLDRSCL